MINDSVTKLNVINENENIFDSGKYVIPLYQREFAWEEKQLQQLIEDINSIDENDYYLGSLIVSKKEDKYEVIDGQQRLTALFLLLNCLGYTVENNLEFACRKKSNYTLNNIRALIKDKNDLDNDLIETGITSGIKLLIELIEKEDKTKFIEKLKKVILYRIEVPEHTDLNHYFEIMNTRGEQLEQQDILKAELMSYLSEDSDREVFAMIWDACSDMTGYVQMHFISKNNRIRNNLFGCHWNELPSKNYEDIPFNNYEDIKNIIISKDDEENTEKTNVIKNNFTIQEIISPNFKIEEDKIIDNENEDTKIRFESIIDFPYFLLHTLKVFIMRDKPKYNIQKLLDDKKLCKTFEDLIKNEYKDNKENFSKEFITCLLKTRFLFDKYIIKREFLTDDSEGEWSLKSIYTSGEKSKKKAYAKNTYDYKNPITNNTNIMIQSALRVSFTSPKIMHWITELLSGLYYKYNEYVYNYTTKAEEIAKEDIRDFLNKRNYSMGVNTPHIVLNFLDYIIWRDKPKEYDFLNYNDFVFEFRNSVEHWYPRNPSDGTIPIWEKDEDGSVDRFGNLCLVQRTINSKFSNMPPEAKSSTFEKMIAKGSLKLRIMSEITGNAQDWKITTCEKHEKEMLGLLQKEVL